MSGFKHFDINGKRIKVGQKILTQHSECKFIEVTVRKITPKRIKFGTFIPDFKSDKEETDWWGLHEDTVYFGDRYPHEVMVIKEDERFVSQRTFDEIQRIFTKDKQCK